MCYLCQFRVANVWTLYESNRKFTPGLNLRWSSNWQIKNWTTNLIRFMCRVRVTDWNKLLFAFPCSEILATYIPATIQCSLSGLFPFFVFAIMLVRNLLNLSKHYLRINFYYLYPLVVCILNVTFRDIMYLTPLPVSIVQRNVNEINPGIKLTPSFSSLWNASVNPGVDFSLFLFRVIMFVCGIVYV